MFNTMSKIGWEGGGSTSIWMMSLNILFFFGALPITTFKNSTAVPCRHFFHQIKFFYIMSVNIYISYFQPVDLCGEFHKALRNLPNCSAWLWLKLNTKIGSHTTHHPPPPHELLGSNISADTDPIWTKL